MHKHQKGFAPIIIALIVLILAGAGGAGYYLMNKQSPKQTACTMEAKICPDGSSVGRTGPNCEFAVCPEVKVDETANWKIYTNKEFGYEIKYPNDWTYREYPDTQNGAGFRPTNMPNEIQYEFINIGAMPGAETTYDTPFSDYVKKAAINEIEGFEKLNSIEEITTDTGIKGYKTTWIRHDMRQKKVTSLPITYFDYQKTIGSFKYKTIQILLHKEDYKKIYEQMLSTFKFTNLAESQLKTYTNEKYGFTVKYPSSAKINETTNGVSIAKVGDVKIVTQEKDAYNSARLKTKEECIFTSKEESNKQYLTLKNANQEINGILFNYYVNYPENIGDYCGMSTGCQYKDIYRTFYNNLCYEISSTRWDRIFTSPSTSDNYRAATEKELMVPKSFNQMLYTFKFLK